MFIVKTSLGYVGVFDFVESKYDARRFRSRERAERCASKFSKLSPSITKISVRNKLRSHGINVFPTDNEIF